MLNNAAYDAAKPLVERHFQEAAPFWQSIYENQDVYGRIHQKRRDLVFSSVDRLRLPPHSDVLDIGCGAGSISVGLASRKFSVYAIDPVPEMIARTRRAAGEAKLRNVRAEVGDIHHLPFAVDTFDLVLAIGVLPWLSSYGSALAEIRRVLRPGGFFIANIDNTLALHRLLDPGTNFLVRPWKNFVLHILEAVHLRRRPTRVPATTILPGRFRDLLRSSGFTPRSQAMYGFGPLSFFGRPVLSPRAGVTVHNRLQALCERNVPLIRALGAQYLVMSQKGSF